MHSVSYHDVVHAAARVSMMRARSMCDGPMEAMEIGPESDAKRRQLVNFFRLCLSAPCPCSARSASPLRALRHVAIWSNFGLLRRSGAPQTLLPYILISRVSARHAQSAEQACPLTARRLSRQIRLR